MGTQVNDFAKKKFLKIIKPTKYIHNFFFIFGSLFPRSFFTVQFSEFYIGDLPVYGNIIREHIYILLYFSFQRDTVKSIFARNLQRKTSNIDSRMYSLGNNTDAEEFHRRGRLRRLLPAEVLRRFLTERPTVLRIPRRRFR